MDVVIGAVFLFVVYLLVEAYFRREDIRRFLIGRIEKCALVAFRFAAQRNATDNKDDRKAILALSSQVVIDIAQRLPSASLIRALADGCVDDDVRMNLLAIAESTKRRGRRALLAKTQRTQRTGQVQE